MTRAPRASLYLRKVGRLLRFKSDLRYDLESTGLLGKGGQHRLQHATRTDYKADPSTNGCPVVLLIRLSRRCAHSGAENGRPGDCGPHTNVMKASTRGGDSQIAAAA